MDLEKQGWERTVNPNQVYYSPFKGFKTKKIYKPIGFSNHPLYPQDMLDILKYKEDGWREYDDNLLYKDEKDYLDEDEVVHLPNGIYRYYKETMTTPERIEQFDLRVDKTVILKNSSHKIITDIKNFVSNEPTYRKLGIIWKLGLLCYGVPGNSKSLSIREALLLPELEDSVKIFIGGGMPSVEFLTQVDKTLRGRMKVFIFEEFITTVGQSQPEQILNFLDGDQSIDQSIILATTN